MFVAEASKRLSSCPTAAEVAAIEEPLAEVVGLLNAATARLTDLVAKALTTGAWQQAGIRSPEHWLAWKAGVSSRRAARLVAIARRRVELPVTTSAFDTGSLSEDQVAEIALRVPAHNDEEVAGLAAFATVSQLRRITSRYPFDPPADQDPPGPKPEDAPDRNLVTFGYDDAGRWRLRAELDADLGAVVERALQACRDAEHHDRHPDADPNAPVTGVTWADALTRLADACLVGLAGDRPAGDRHQVILHVRADTTHREARLHLGPAVPSAVRRLLSCDAVVRYLLEDATGVPLALGRRQRGFTAAQRTLIEDRHGGQCARPGCPHQRGLHLHHHVHWEDGGATDLDNVIPLCARDHRLHHEGRLHITGDPAHPETLVFSDHHGRILSPSAEPVPPDPRKPLIGTAGDLELPTPTWDHPTGERLQADAISFTHPATAA